jgi:glycosyltransferase involved in cell wall biosynthesis
MTKLICVMPIYNCSDVVLKALASIDGKVDEIKCFDGRWVGHDGPDYSPDNTIDLIKEWGKTSKTRVSIYRIEPKFHEWEFHNEILKYIDNGDWILKLDSDEIILEWDENTGRILQFSDEKAYRVFWHFFKPYTALPNAKLFRKTETLYYDRNHREIYDGSGWIDVPRAPMIRIVFDHQPEADTKKDRANMREYEKRNAEYEQAERKNQSN